MRDDRSYPSLSDVLKRQLAAFEPSRGVLDISYWPSHVELIDGTERDHVVLVRATEYIRVWGVWPENDPGKRSIPIESISAIRESRRRLPPAAANKLYAAGESGMGYVVFTVVLRDGRHLPFVTGGLVDFPALPEDVSSDDVVDVLPDVGREQFRERVPSEEASAVNYAWCLFG
jgi:hypothetical protein